MLFSAPESDKPEIAAFIPLPGDTKGTVARLWDAFVQKSTAGMVLILLGHPSRAQGHRCNGGGFDWDFPPNPLSPLPLGDRFSLKSILPSVLERPS